MQSIEAAAEERTANNPPAWLLQAIGVGYLVGLAVLLFLPGGTMLDRLRALVGGICAQLPTHTYAPGGQPLPLCSRNTGIYLGFAIGVFALFARGHGRSARLPSGWVACVLLLGVAIMGVDGVNSLFLDLHLPHLYQPANPLRLATGFLTGTAMAAYLVPVANGIVWRSPDTRAAYPTVSSLAVLLPALAIGWLVVASQAGIWLYPVALISSPAWYWRSRSSI